MRVCRRGTSDVCTEPTHTAPPRTQRRRTHLARPAGEVQRVEAGRGRGQVSAGKPGAGTPHLRECACNRAESCGEGAAPSRQGLDGSLPRSESCPTHLVVSARKLLPPKLDAGSTTATWFAAAASFILDAKAEVGADGGVAGSAPWRRRGQRDAQLRQALPLQLALVQEEGRLAGGRQLGARAHR